MARPALKWLKFAIGIAVTLVFVWLIAETLDIDAVRAAVARVPASALLAALACIALGCTCRILRWWWMLRAFAPDLPRANCTWPLLTSIAVNNVLPFRAGDALRVFGFRTQLRAPASRLLSTLMIERMLDMAVLLSFFFLGLLWLPEGSFPDRFVTIATWLSGGLFLLSVAVIFLAPLFRRLLMRAARGAAVGQGGWRSFVAEHGNHFIDAFEVASSPARLVVLVLFSVLVWSFEGAVFAIVAVAIHTGTDLAGAWFAMATGTLSTLLPSSPGYVGTFDYFTAQGLEAFGAQPDLAIAFALIVHVILWTSLTVPGLAYLVLVHGGLGEVFSARAGRKL